MSFSYGYNPKVAHPYMLNSIPQMSSFKDQIPFYFGGAQAPTALNLARIQYNGSKGEGFHKGSPSLTHPGDMDFTAKIGTQSRTHIGDMAFTTKKGDKVFHRKGHNIKLPHSMPFQK